MFWWKLLIEIINLFSRSKQTFISVRQKTLRKETSFEFGILHIMQRKWGFNLLPNHRSSSIAQMRSFKKYISRYVRSNDVCTVESRWPEVIRTDGMSDISWPSVTSFNTQIVLQIRRIFNPSTQDLITWWLTLTGSLYSASSN